MATTAQVQKVHDLMEVVDLNKDNISEKDYLQVCNILKDIYNDYDCMQHVGDELDIPYHNSEFLKQIVGILVIVTNIANIILIFILYDSGKKII